MTAGVTRSRSIAATFLLTCAFLAASAAPARADITAFLGVSPTPNNHAAKGFGVGVGLFSAAGLLALYGLAALLTTVVMLIDLALPLWASALIVTAVLFAAAGVAALTGKKQVTQATPPAPEKAIAGVKEDVATLKAGSNDGSKGGTAA